MLQPILDAPNNGTDDLIVNLKSIAGTQVHDKLCIITNGRYIVRDERMFQSIMRHLTGDCRDRVIEFMEKLLVDIRTQLSTDTGWKRDKIIELIPDVINGMKNLRFTYCTDRIILFRLENIIDSLCNLQLDNNEKEKNIPPTLQFK